MSYWLLILASLATGALIHYQLKEILRKMATHEARLQSILEGVTEAIRLIHELRDSQGGDNPALTDELDAIEAALAGVDDIPPVVE